MERLYIDVSIGCANISNLDKDEIGFVIKDNCGYEIWYPFWGLDVEGLDVVEIEKK
jgi:hypothetical protein